MAQLIAFSVKRQPSILLIGKQLRYNMQAHMQGDNRMPAFWQTCFAQDAFAPLEAQGRFPCDDAYVGTMPWCMQRYGETFATPDADGDIVLDYYIPLGGKT